MAGGRWTWAGKGEGAVTDELKTGRPCSHSCVGWTQLEEGVEVCAKVDAGRQ